MLPLGLLSQNKFILSGVVKDSETGEVINYVNIKAKKSKAGTTTNFRGQFSFYSDKMPDTLVFSHVAYESQKLPVSGTTSNISIKLIRKTSMLPEVPVNSNIAIDLIEKKLFDVVDYEFMGDSLLLMAYSWKEKINPWFILMNSSGDTLKKIHVHDEGVFYRDCMDILYFITERAAWQISMEDDKLLLFNPVNAEKFKEQVSPCITSIKDKFFVKQYYANSQILSYYVVDSTDKKNKEFRIIADEVALRMLGDRNRFHSMGASAPTEADLRFEQMCFFDPIFAPLLKIKDRVVIFNFVESKFEIYNENGDLEKEGALNYHKEKNWKEQMYADEITGKVYLKYLKAGITTLKEFDLETEQITKTIDLPGYKYIDKIKIRNNQLYFLYRLNEPLELTRLYKLKSF
jgi:hypothetical protein